MSAHIRARSARRCCASGASLDLDTVLREVVDAARALTGAGCGAIATVDELGRPGDFVTSGLTEDEHRALEEWPDGHGLFAPSRRPGRADPAGRPRGVRERADPLALPDRLRRVPGHADAPPGRPCRQLLPRHQGRRVHRGGRGGAGAARRPGCRRPSPMRGRTARSGAPAPTSRRWSRPARSAWWCSTPPPAALASLNREARRIVAGLVSPELPVERLPGAMTCRRGDGRAVTLDDLGRGETVRAEEVELSVPGGASVRTLLDATPDPCRGRRGGAAGGDPAGPGAVRGAGAVPRRLPLHGEPRAAHAAGGDQGLGRGGAGGRARARPRGAAPVPAHRSASRPTA